MATNQKHYLVGYGSLLSHDSRSRHSNIFCPNMPIVVNGWQREWLARGLAHLQTALGVSQVATASLNAVLLRIEQISPELRDREQDYQFIEVDPNCIVAAQESGLAQTELANIRANPDTCKIFICANLNKIPANSQYPIYQTYIDTCLVGCFDMGVANFAAEFIQNTHFWEHGWINDRHHCLYARPAIVTQQQHQQIDQLLEQHQVLEYRQETKR
jgi:hypothetical protein